MTTLASVVSAFNTAVCKSAYNRAKRAMARLSVPEQNEAVDAAIEATKRLRTAGVLSAPVCTCHACRRAIEVVAPRQGSAA